MDRRVVIALVVVFCGGFLVGRVANPEPPDILSPDFHAPVRLNVIDGTRITGDRLVPYRVMRDGKPEQLRPMTPGGRGTTYHLIYETDPPVEVFLAVEKD